ncbi:MAG: serine/threonine-protein kinase [Deltaproteobacteria bacterium]|nr:serine/threonine-protein kinase [Deltaproteobacteria bacterium]
MKKLGRYRLTELLGQGGMGDVWAAVSEGLGGFEKKVCIKVMKAELAGNERAVELFLREARLAARLTHPNIVQIFELGREQGTYFIAMEMLEGMAWHDVAQRAWRHGKVLPLEVIVVAAAHAAEALQYAHTLTDKDGKRLGMVHRDVSPDNLFLTGDGTTKVLDFGIAKAVSLDATRLTEKGELRGKLPYMPPEQVKTDDVDGSADTWALGVTLFYLSTAQRPFDRATPLATMNAILKEPAISALSMNPVLPKAFGDVIARCLQKDPKDRWPSAAAVKEALLGLLPGPPDPAKARALLALTSSLEKGDRRPLSAQPCAPSISWDKAPPAPPAPPTPPPAKRAPPAPKAATPVVTPPKPAAPPPRAEDRLPTRQRSQAEAPPGTPERTVVSAPLLTADQSADESRINEDDDSEEDPAGFAEDVATLAEMPSLSMGNASMAGKGPSLKRPSRDESSDEDDDDVASRAEPTQAIAMQFSGQEQFSVALSELDLPPAVDPALADDGPLPVGLETELLRVAEAPTQAIDLPPAVRMPLPVWVFGVGAFAVTVIVTLLIVGLAHVLRS